MAARFLYNVLVLPLIRFGASVASPFVSKIRTGLAGRRDLIVRTQEFRRQNPEARVALFHCASAGELEGIRPLARAIRERGFAVAVTYFSPSAKEVAATAREFAFADYSPIDQAGAVAEFYDVLKPDIVLISKHDVWPNMVWKASEREVPVWLVNGNFHPRSMRVWPIVREFHRSIYSSLTGILAVSEADATRARAITANTTRVESVGDSRFDRVFDRASRNRGRFARLKSSLNDRYVVVAGSTHDLDERCLFPALSELRADWTNLCAVVIPHDPSDEAVKRIRELAELNRLSVVETDGESEIEHACDVVLVNRGGVLADLYAVGNLSYVGGAFDRGVHSVIEPMAHGLPVTCGPNIAVSQEAREARAMGLLAVIESPEELCAALRRMHGRSDNLSAEALKFVERGSGAARNILRVVLNSDA